MDFLDTEQWIENVEIQGEMKPQIMYSYYSKSMASKFVIHNDSAISARSKTNILIADLLRIMKTISRNCPDEERKKKIQEFIKRMQFSGYPKKERAYVYKKAKSKYDECLRKHDAGEQPFYRGKSWNFKERKEEKRVKRKTWYQSVTVRHGLTDLEDIDRTQREITARN